MIRWSLFVVALLFFASSLLLFFPAPTDWLLIVAIALGEWGHYAALLALLLAAFAWRKSRAASVVALLTAIICLTPAMRAGQIGRTLPERCSDAFGRTEKVPRAPFSVWNLFRPLPRGDVTVGEHAYAIRNGKELKLDLYQRNGTRDPQPLVVVVHGGSWARGSKNELPAIDRYLAHQGYSVASINYRLTPQAQFPAAIDDAFAAIAFLKTRAADFHLDVTRMVMLGRSAGGEIALNVAYSGRDPAIRGVIAFYPPTDLLLGYAHPSPRLVLDSRSVLENYLGGTPTEKHDEYAAASPVNLVNANTPPTLLIHGQLDSIVWPVHSELLNTRLQQAGRPHLYLSLVWATHGCDANPIGPSGQLSLYAIERFLAAVLR